MIFATNQLRLQNYKEIESNQAEIRKFRHDLKNKLLVLRYLFDEKEYDKADELLDNYSEEFSKHTKFLETGSTVIDAILNTKIAANKHIKFALHIKITEDISVKEIDVITILGNLIDNASEALNRDYIAGEISVTLVVADGVFMLKIANPYKTLNMDDKRVLTLKKDDQNHGIGLRNVKMTVSKYDGTFEVNTSDYIFTTKIIIH